MQAEKSHKNNHGTPLRVVFAVVLLALVSVAGAGYLGYESYTLKNTLGDEMTTSAATESELRNTIALLESQIANLTENLEEEREENEDLRDDLDDERNQNDRFEDQIKDLAGTVGILDKLSKTDKELLQKYSKVYFLNEHYIPERLTKVDDEYSYDETRDHYLHSKVAPYFEKMVEDALDDDINLWVVSAYRSFEMQTQLKGQYTITYGSGANTFSADQGYSEHQLGTTIDFTTDNLGGGLTGFGNTPAYEWLLDNAHKYGFVLSYPENNQYYVFEPWHWRFVGEDLADYLHDNDLNFYDVEQRKIDEYLISIFD